MNRKSSYSIREREIAGKLCYSICHDDSGEVMHSSEDPVLESRRLYIEQPKLANRIAVDGHITIWDVGLGAAFNAMNVVKLFQDVQLTDKATLSLVSFENDLEPIKKVLSNPSKFLHLNSEMISTLLDTGRFESDRLSWKLVYGDFLENFYQQPMPDLIFYDPFSYKVDSPMWSLQTFERLSHFLKDTDCEIFTFSASTAFRAALLLAGFYVARGVSTGKKQETTIALTPKAAIGSHYPLLDRSWLVRWEKSSAKYPLGVGPENHKTSAASILSHPQFE